MVVHLKRRHFGGATYKNLQPQGVTVTFLASDFARCKASLRAVVLALDVFTSRLHQAGGMLLHSCSANASSSGPCCECGNTTTIHRRRRTLANHRNTLRLRTLCVRFVVGMCLWKRVAAAGAAARGLWGCCSRTSGRAFAGVAAPPA
jgi:hypothetical protein